MKKINVLHYVFKWLPRTENWIYHQIAHLPLEEIDPHIFCERETHLKEFDLPNIHNPCRQDLYAYVLDKMTQKAGMHRSLKSLEKVLQREQINVLHSHFADFGWMNIPAAQRAGVRHCVTFYGYDVGMLPQKLLWQKRYKELFASDALFLCEGPHMARCIQDLGCPESKVHIHHLGVDVGHVLFKKRQWETSNPFRILIAATFKEKKGMPLALKAIREMWDIPLEVTVIGDVTRDGSSRQEKRNILKMAQECGPHQKIRFLGFQPYDVLLQEAYQHHVFLSPSVTASNGDTEGGAPVILLDMMACGLPVLASRHCDIPELIDHGQTGFLAREGDSKDLEIQLRWIIENYHSEKINTVVVKARSRVEQDFNAVFQSQKLAQIYKKVIRI